MSTTAVDDFMAEVVESNPGEPDFHQAVLEVVESVMPLVLANPDYRKDGILERIVEPDRIVSFRVTWEDDNGDVRINRGWRVQFNNALGPYKGGLRFHPTVNQSVLKFLGFEQTFKNALTSLPMGGGKGGSNFDPKGKSSREVMRFCQSFMIELHRHIGDAVDTPAGDIGVGAREIGYLFGQYARIESAYAGVLTGKGLEYGGSHLRPEATGYGLGYFVGHMADDLRSNLAGLRVGVSGSGNVAIYAAEKFSELGARVVTLSDSLGMVHDPDGITAEKLAFVRELKFERRGSLAEYADHVGCEYRPGERPWSVPVDIAAPCATQNELDVADARTLADNGVRIVAEGANMPCTVEALAALADAGVAFGPAKACNAGGVAVSGLEQSQNAMGLTFSAEEVDRRLRAIMADIHRQCREHSPDRVGPPDYLTGANRAAFSRVASALSAFGLI